MWFVIAADYMEAVLECTPMTKTGCLICQRTSDETPLLTLEYRDSTIRICAQHLPVLIHDPARLIGILPGAENLSASDVHD